MNRGADRQDIFSDEFDHLRFEELVGDAVDRFGVEAHAYALMTNHFHLLLRCPEGGLSASMQLIEHRYTQWYNARHHRDGPLYRGRFTSVDVTDDDQLVTAGRYIHRNPLALVPVSVLAAYRWSSFGVYAGRRAQPDWLAVDVVARGFGQSAYREFVERELPSDAPSSPPMCLAARDVTTAVRTVTGVEERVLRQPAPGVANSARLVAIALCVEWRVGTSDELADHFGVGSRASLRGLARRGRVAMAADPGLARLRQRVLAVAVAGNLSRSA